MLAVFGTLTDMRDMTETDLHWVAGLLEGEGCFHFTMRPNFRFVVKCNMTDEDVIRRLHAVVGAGNVRGPLAKRTQTGTLGKPQWLWTLGRTQGADELLPLLLPLMGARRSDKMREILTLVEWHPRRPGWKHGTVHGYDGKGCRCDRCRAAWAVKHRRRRASRLKGRPPLRHGTRNAYERRGCRCDPCVKRMDVERASRAAQLRTLRAAS